MNSKKLIIVILISMLQTSLLYSMEVEEVEYDVVNPIYGTSKEFLDPFASPEAISGSEEFSGVTSLEAAKNLLYYQTNPYELPYEVYKKLVKDITEYTGKVPQKEDEVNPLYSAMQNLDIDFLRYLLQHGADPYFDKGLGGGNAYDYLDLFTKLPWKITTSDPVAVKIKKINKMKKILDSYQS